MTHPENAQNTRALPLLRIRFAPDNLPSGSVDLMDLADFISGLQLILDGIAHYQQTLSDVEPSPIPQSRLTVVGYEVNSADFLISLQPLFEFLQTNLGTLAGGAVLVYLYSFLKRLGENHADRVSKEPPEDAQKTIEDAQKTIKELQYLLIAATSMQNQGQGQIPTPLLGQTMPGLRRIASVAAKPSYQKEGIAVSREGDPNSVVTLNAEVAAHIEHLSSQSDKGEAGRWYGTIDEPSTKKKEFTLVLPTPYKRKRRIKCRYDAAFSDSIRQFYSSRALVEVSGIYYYQPSARGSQPRSYIALQAINPSKEPTLFGNVNKG